MWTSLAKTQFTLDQQATENPMLHYYLNKANVYAIGDNIDNMFGVFAESQYLTQLTPILSGVKKLVMLNGTSFDIKYDNSFNFMGDPTVGDSFRGLVNVKDIAMSKNYIGLILKLDGTLYYTGVGSPFQIMDNIRKIQSIPDTEDFLVEDNNNMYFITYTDWSNVGGNNVQIKFKNSRTMVGYTMLIFGFKPSGLFFFARGEKSRGSLKNLLNTSMKRILSPRIVLCIAYSMT